MKLEAITIPTPAPRSDLENLIIGMNRARKGTSTPQENNYTLRIAEQMQREAFQRGDSVFTIEFTELFNFTCEQVPAPLEEAVIEGDFEVVDGKPSAQRPPKEFLKLNVENAASYRFLTDLQTRIRERKTMFEIDVLKSAQHYGITRQAIRSYLRDYANKGLISLKIKNAHKTNVSYHVGPVATNAPVMMPEAVANNKTHKLINYIRDNASDIAIYVEAEKLSKELNIKASTIVTLLNIFKNKGYIYCKCVENGIRLVRFIEAPDLYN